MHKELLEGLENRHGDTSVSINDEARLTYLKNVDIFTLELREEDVNIDNKQEKLVERLLEKVVSQEERILALEQENKTLRSDFEKSLVERLEKFLMAEVRATNKQTNEVYRSLVSKIDILEHKRLTAIEADLKGIKDRINGKEVDNISKILEFDDSNNQMYNFIFTNSKATATYIQGTGWRGLFSKQILVKSSKSRFSVKINATSKSNIIVGICPSSMKFQENVFLNQDVYGYCGNSGGSIYAHGKATYLSNFGFTTNSLITMTVNFSKNTIRYDLNGTMVHKGDLDASHGLNYEFNPFIALHDLNDKVTLC